MADYQEIAETLAMMRAEADTMPDMKRCIEGEKMLYLECDRAVVPGHVYSQNGLREARISGMCEYHFDRLFEPGWTDVITGEKGCTPPEGDMDDMLLELRTFGEQ